MFQQVVERMKPHVACRMLNNADPCQEMCINLTPPIGAIRSNAASVNAER